jgi:hypothetical protein
VSTVLNMSISLEGFVAGPDEAPQNLLGDGGMPLRPVGHRAVLEGALARAGWTEEG